MGKIRPVAALVAQNLKACYPKARMSSAPEPETPAEAAQPPEPERAPREEREGAEERRRPKKKKKLRPREPAPPLSEDQIDSPNRQTIGMLSVIGILTFFMWIFARGGCNYHPPKETRDPRKVDLAELARDPKDAAMEFELRYATKRFGGALELAKGSMVSQIEAEQKKCDADPGCAQRASDLRSTVQVVGQLLERDPFRSTSRVITYGVGGSPERHIIKVERDGALWKTLSREVDDGSFKPRPAGTPFQRERPGHLLLRQPGMPGAESGTQGSESDPHGSH
jgi:hypothetical protein